MIRVTAFATALAISVVLTGCVFSGEARAASLAERIAIAMADDIAPDHYPEPLTGEHLAWSAIEGDEGVHFERAWLDPESGKVFCLSTGPSKEAVMRIHERAGHPTEQVFELAVEV